MEKIQFQRGKGIKENLSIGRIGNPILIASLNPLEAMPQSPDGTIGYSVGNMSDKNSHKILEGIESREILFWEDLYYCAVVTLNNKFDATDWRYRKLSEYKGEYVMLNGIKYLIPS